MSAREDAPRKAPSLAGYTTGRPIPPGAYPVFLGVAAVGWLALILFVVGFGEYGETFTAGVDVACAEAAFLSGKKLEAAGNYDLAIQRFRQALEGRFRDKEREYLCARSVGEILLKLGRYAEAIETFRGLPEEQAFTASGSLTGYVTALFRAGQYAEAERLGKAWLAKAETAQDRQQMLWAYATLGLICHETSRLDEAIRYYRAAEAIDPACQSGVMIAHALHSQGKMDEAISQLDAFLERAKPGQLHEDAKRLRSEFLGQQARSEGP